MAYLCLKVNSEMLEISARASALHYYHPPHSNSIARNLVATKDDNSPLIPCGRNDSFFHSFFKTFSPDLSYGLRVGGSTMFS